MLQCFHHPKQFSNNLDFFNMMPWALANMLTSSMLGFNTCWHQAVFGFKVLQVCMGTSTAPDVARGGILLALLLGHLLDLDPPRFSFKTFKQWSLPHIICIEL